MEAVEEFVVIRKEGHVGRRELSAQMNSELKVNQFSLK